MNARIPSTSGVPRPFSVIRTLTQVPDGGGRVTQIARSVGLTQAITHRLLRSLAAEGIVARGNGSFEGMAGVATTAATVAATGAGKGAA